MFFPPFYKGTNLSIPDIINFTILVKYQFGNKKWALSFSIIWDNAL